MDACDKKSEYDMDQAILGIDYRAYKYPFENLVFEGGGAKGTAYIGCLKVLEEIGIKPKRIAGTSAGAIIATLVAVGYKSDEIEEIMKEDLEKLLIDHSWGYLSFIPNILKRFGWNSAQKFVDFTGKLLAEKLGNADVTFKELFDKRNIELCLVAVTVNMATVTYFHPKTSPNFPIRKALRMSISLPGLFEPVVNENSTGAKDYYIDGGLLCNYPIHVYDGWWLSMKNDDAFLTRLQPFSQLHKFVDKGARFNEYNTKTLGFIVYSASENDFMRKELEKRVGIEMSERPKDSKLYKSRAEQQRSENLEDHGDQRFLCAADRFMKALQHIKTQNSAAVFDVLSLKDLEDVLSLAKVSLNQANPEQKGDAGSALQTPEQVRLTQSDINILFGEKHTTKEIFDKLDVDKTGEITYAEIIKYMTRAGHNVYTKFLGYERNSINGIRNFVSAIEDCLMANAQKMFMQARDIERTVGINTDYVQTTDFNMEQSDREFLKKQGRNSTIAFLKQYAAAQARISVDDV